MAKKKAKAETSPAPAIVAQGIAPPPTQPASPDVSVGVQGDPPQVATGGPIISAAMAGSDSSLFKKGGDAFAAFCAAKGIDTNQHRKAEEWSELLDEFAARPIFGCRRGPSGGDHRANAESLV